MPDNFSSKRYYPVLDVVITDLTESKHAQDAPENQLIFFADMIDTFPNPLFYLDTHGHYLGSNSAHEILTKKNILRTLQEKQMMKSVIPVRAIFSTGIIPNFFGTYRHQNLHLIVSSDGCEYQETLSRNQQ